MRAAITRRKLLAWPLLAAAPRLRAAAAGVPALQRGVNLSHWFEYECNLGPSAQELQGLAQAGLDHVRVPVDPLLLGWQPQQARPTIDVTGLRAAVQGALLAGLDVVVDLHLLDATKKLIEAERGLEPHLAALWSQLAAALADLPAERVAFELYNEPQYYGLKAMAWPALQRRLLAALRAKAPRHLVLLAGNQGGSFEGLVDLPLASDERVAYTVHFYEPFFFTHQGVPWLDPQHTAAGAWAATRYPAAMVALAPPRRVREHPRGEAELARYRSEDWNAGRIEDSLRGVGRWARRNQVRVLCNEFGVFRDGVDAHSRYRWLGDVRLALQQHGLGWTVWDFAHHFGIARSAGPGAPRVLEAGALRALGLKVRA